MKAETHIPMIKGVFVNSHVKAVRKRKGEAGVRLLESKYGASVSFKYLDDVPIREEVRIIEFALDILSEQPVPPGERAFEAGRLHFRNFSTTPVGRLILNMLPRKFKYIMLGIPNIATHVFRNVQFSAKDIGPCAVQITMRNNDYPADHFRGLFFEWMNFWNYPGEVNASVTGPDEYEYVLRWKETSK
ncbi:MAG: hypothetical protein FD123_3401 [Bacteroidetes bacterium]|nr:MAG: hypothetical protein FD123_3401 [Bacteroidota bacterium]